MSETLKIANDLMGTPLFRSVLDGGQGGEAVEGLRYLAIGFGAVLLFLGHVQRSRDALIGRFSPDPARVIIITVALTFMLFAGGRVVGLAAKAGNEMPAAIGLGSTPDFIKQCFGRAMALGANPIEIAKQHTSDLLNNPEPASGSEEEKKSGGFSLNPVRWLAAAADWVIASSYYIIRAVLGFIAFILILIAVAIAALITYLMESLRFLALVIGAAILPLFIGGLSLDRTKGMGFTYISGILGLCLWPVGWAIGNLVTLELVDLSITTLTNGQAVDRAREVLRTGTLPSDADSITSALMTQSFSLISWSVGLLLLVVTILWILFAAVTVPLAMVKTLTTGQEFLSQSVTGAAGSAAKVVSEVGKTAVVAAA